jgi:hypothetical protein
MFSTSRTETGCPVIGWPTQATYNGQWFYTAVLGAASSTISSEKFHCRL